MKVLKTYDFLSERMKIRPMTNAEWKQTKEDMNKNPFGLTKKDLTGKIKDFPMGVVVKMLEEQQKQVNKVDVSVFQKKASTTSSNGGFDWLFTEDKYDFWRDIISGKKFDVFFDKYPEYEKYNLD